MIHLIVGNTGAGKTTYAHKLRTTTNGIIFSIDKWNNTLFFPDKTPEDGLTWILERMERVESMVIDTVQQLEGSGIDSILDLGFSKYEHREKFRLFAESHGFEMTTHFLDIPTDIRLQRVMQRNNEQGETFEFEVTKENFDFMEQWFEQPTQAEMEHGIIITH
jgi:predicted kinase